MVYIEKNFLKLEEILINFGIKDRKVCIITDTTVAKYYLEEVYNICENALEVFKFVFLEGEKNKNLVTVNDIYEYLLENDFTRKDFLIALGGGLVGDLVGFVASTYMRGIDFINLPTSLLAMVDSSIGAKTGVNFLSYKNIIGSFYEAKLVYMNVSCLNSLKDIEFSSGMVEVIKYGLIEDENYYEYIINNIDLINKRDIGALKILIEKSVYIKNKIVVLDPREEGIRKILNFGHTLGHALEKHSDFGYKHGIAVAFGSLVAILLSIEKGFIEEKEFIKLSKLYKKLGIFFDLRDSDIEVLIRYMRKDKKRDNNSYNFILLKSIGKAYIDTSIIDDDIRQVLGRFING